MITNERGQFRFPILPPATYALEIHFAGFATYREADVGIGVGTDNLFSPNFGRPSIFIDPRRVMIGMRLNLGQP